MLCTHKNTWATRPPRVVFAVRFYLAQAVLQRGGLSIDSAQWFQSEAVLDRLENRKRVVLRVVHKTTLGTRSDDDSRNARTIAPDAVDWRCHVIPTAAVFVIGHNDERVVPIVAVAHCAHKIHDLLLTLPPSRLSRILLLLPPPLNYSHPPKPLL